MWGCARSRTHGKKFFVHFVLFARARRHHDSRFHPAKFLSHDLADIVTAAVYADARHIVDNIALLKSRALGAATAAADASAI